MTYIFSVEGNIGSGKSTIIKNLKNTLYNLNNRKVIYLPEPVDVWESIKDSSGKNIIECYYENQEENAFSFQMMAYISRIHQLRTAVKNNPGSIIITERSVLTDKNVFAKMLYDEKKIREIDYTIYLKWFDEFKKETPISGIIYIKTNPELASKRVLNRNRKGETIPIEYLKMCNTYHNNWLLKSNIPILEMDGRVDFLNNISEKWCLTIKEFIKKYIPEPISFDFKFDINALYC